MFRRFRLVVAVALVGIFFVVMHGQAPSSAPPSTPAPAAPPTESVPPITTIHARSNLVVVDVVVSDSKQNPVHGLKQEDLHADGERQAAVDPKF